MQSTATLDDRSRDLRRHIVQTMVDGNQGHLGSALSLVEILRVLYDDILDLDPANPDWPDRDRFLLSKAHGCLAYYVMLADKGFIPRSELSRFAQFNGQLGGHSERHIPGVEVATGSLGHGLSLAVGFALAARLQKAEWRTFVVVGDGELNEGSVWEGAMSAAKHQLDSLTLLVDYNRLQSAGSTEDIQPLEPLALKLESFGFATFQVDGHDLVQLKDALLQPTLGRPKAVICHTIKGRGIPMCEHNLDWHHKSKLAPDLVAELFQALADPT